MRSTSHESKPDFKVALVLLHGLAFCFYAVDVLYCSRSCSWLCNCHDSAQYQARLVGTKWNRFDLLLTTLKNFWRWFCFKSVGLVCTGLTKRFLSTKRQRVFDFFKRLRLRIVESNSNWSLTYLHNVQCVLFLRIVIANLFSYPRAPKDEYQSRHL